MSSIGRALDLLERLVDEIGGVRAELAAVRAALPSAPRPRPKPVPDPEPSETDRAAARKLARGLGLVVRGSGR